MSTMFPEVCKIEVKVGYHDSVGHLGLSRLFRTQWALTIQWAVHNSVDCVSYSIDIE